MNHRKFARIIEASDGSDVLFVITAARPQLPTRLVAETRDDDGLDVTHVLNYGTDELAWQALDAMGQTEADTMREYLKMWKARQAEKLQ